MKTMNFEQMEKINGGWNWGRFCDGMEQVGIASGIAVVLCSALVTPFFAAAIIAANTSCWAHGY